MTSYSAVLVEDEDAAETETVKALQAAGFGVSVFRDATSALIGLSQLPSPIDLIVLDRRLPSRAGDMPLDVTGDQLLGEVLDAYSDVPVVVFSGHSNYEHLQFVMINRGSLDIGHGRIVLSRVVAFEKGQSLEFDRYLSQLRACLDFIQDVSVTFSNEPVACTDLDRRILRRVAIEFDAIAVDAQQLNGGSTDASVWLCSLLRSDRVDAAVVVKSSTQRPVVGGFQVTIPATLSAATLSTVLGLCGGRFVAVQQLAGADAASLLDLIVDEAETAAQGLSVLVERLPKQSVDPVHRTIEQLVAPVKTWSDVVTRLENAGIVAPAGTRVAKTKLIHQHGDLHPGNVLLVNGDPVLIDFDRQAVGSPLVDTVALFLGPLFARGSKAKSWHWPAVEQCGDVMSADFLVDCPAPAYFKLAQDLCLQSASSRREALAVVMAYAARQFEYPDVKGSALVLSRARAIARSAAYMLVSGVD